MSSCQTLDMTPRTLATEADEMIVTHYQAMKRNLPILEMAAGRGANSIFLADKGFRVDALEHEADSYRQLKAECERRTLSVQAVHGDFGDFQPQIGKYGGLVALDIIRELSRREISLFKERVMTWTKQNSLLFVSGLTVSDPSYEITAANWRKVGRNCFTNGKGKFRCYMEAGEILDLFNEFQVIHHWEGFGEPRHGADGGTYSPALFKAALHR